MEDGDEKDSIDFTCRGAVLGGLVGCGGGKAEGEDSTVSLPAADVQCTAMEQAGRGTAYLMFTFKDGKIHLSIYWVYTNEEIDQTYTMESKGIKID
ncbi:MAG: hypothetical protein ACOX6S_01075 [Clostridia bacterium]|jgi:hypothetical protein